MMLREPWRTRLLFLSFAVNLVTIPIAGTRIYEQYYHRPMPPTLPGGPPPPFVMFDRISNVLSPADKQKLISAAEPHFEEIEVARVHMEASRTAMLRAIGRAPFDPAALQTAMQNWQAAWKTWSDEYGGAFVDAVQKVSPEGRRQLAQAGRRRP